MTARHEDSTDEQGQTGPASCHRGSDHRRRPLSVVIAVTTFVSGSVILAGCGVASGNATSRGEATPLSSVLRWGVVGNGGAIPELQLDRPSLVTGIRGKVVQIATSNSDGYALTSTGVVYGWGVNSDGELGGGHRTPYETKAVKVDFPPKITIRALANPMPFDAGIAIDSAGHAWGWGLNGADDLCLPGLVHVRPQELPLSDVTLAAGARTHALFDSKGRLLACGSGDAGELGNGSTASSNVPTPVVGLPPRTEITALTASWEGSGALLANGDYYDWGYNAAGQLGDGSTTNRAVPVKVALPFPVKQVFQGGSGPQNGQTIAILADGSTWAWGENDRGQLGIGSTKSSDVPVPVHVPHGVAFVRVASGGYASYAIDRSGRLWVWGDNQHGQLGVGSSRQLATRPREIALHFAQVSSTAQNVAGLQYRPPQS